MDVVQRGITTYDNLVFCFLIILFFSPLEVEVEGIPMHSPATFVRAVGKLVRGLGLVPS